MGYISNGKLVFRILYHAFGYLFAPVNNVPVRVKPRWLYMPEKTRR